MRTTMYRPYLVPFLCLLPVAGTVARADGLLLGPATQIDISASGIASIGDLDLNPTTQRLWVADGSTGGRVYEIDAATGSVISSFLPSAIPGLDLGPDALATGAGTNASIPLFSSFGESEGGVVNHAGQLVDDFGTSNGATGATIDSVGHLWIAAGTTAGGGSILQLLDGGTGAVLQSVPIVGNTSRIVDLDFDPISGRCYCLAEDTGALLEVDLGTGQITSSTDLSAFVLAPGAVAGGIAFSASGDALFVGTGSAPAAHTILHVERAFAETVCDGADPAAPCPCGNGGAPGYGCANSVSSTGALLGTRGVPSFSDDTFVLRSTDTPSSATCLFFQTTSESPATPLGDGLLCVGGTAIRLGTHAASGGSTSYPVGGDPELHVRGQIPGSGGTRYYQVWYRNAASFCTPETFNLTNALRVIWGP